jgi:hypothetical protein
MVEIPIPPGWEITVIETSPVDLGMVFEFHVLEPEHGAGMNPVPE